MDESSGIVSFKVKTDSEPVYDEDQWQENLHFDENSETVSDKENMKKEKPIDNITSEELNKTLSQFQETVFGQMEKQQVMMENMFHSVREEFDQYHTRLKMIKEEVSSEIKEDLERSIKESEMRLSAEVKKEKDDYDSPKGNLVDVKVPNFMTSTPKGAQGFQKNVKWNLDEQVKPLPMDKSLEGATKSKSQSDRKGQQCEEEISLNSSDESKQKPSNLEDSDSHKEQVPKTARSSSFRAIKMKPQYYDGSDDWEEYITQFDILSDINNWSYESKSLYLAGSLKGPARAILNELSSSERRDFEKLVRALSNRFGTSNRAEMFRARLQSKTRNKDESIPELAQMIRKLTRQAYPNASSNLLDVLALDHFIDALTDADMRFRLREARPKNIAEAEIIAVRIETHKLADKQRGKVFVRSVDTSQFSEETSNKLPNKNKTQTSSKSGNGRYPKFNKQSSSNVQFGVNDLKQDMEEIKKELKLCQEALCGKKSDSDGHGNENLRYEGNVKIPNSGARVREGRNGPK